MNERRKERIAKRHLRKLARQYRREGDADKAKECLFCANDEAAFDLFVGTLFERHEGAYGSPITDFFQWLIDHKEEILELIMFIVGFFD